MSIRHAAQPQFPLRGLREGPAAPWVRPADWPGLPWIPDAEQALVGLVAIHDTDQEKITVFCAGNYTVDWGDGTAPVNASAYTFNQHQYDYAAIATPVTSRGYKTAIVKIYPQAGQNLTVLQLPHKPTGMGPSAFTAPWLDVQVNAAYCTQLFIGSTSGGGTATLGLLESCNIRAHSLTSITHMLMDCISLRKLHWFDTTNVTNITNFLYRCYAIDDLPVLNFQNVTTAPAAIQECYSLSNIPAFNMPKATSALQILNGAQSLTSVPDIHFEVLDSAFYMFNGCFSLHTIGALDFSNVTNMTNTFTNCRSLSKCDIFGVKVTHSYDNCCFTAAGLNNIFTNLASGVTGKTITVTGNPGAATCDTSIATAKGWTVVT